MSETETKISSPCVGRCLLAACRAVCTGCGRTRDEIATWASIAEERRAEIMALLPERARLLGLMPLAPPSVARGSAGP